MAEYLKKDSAELIIFFEPNIVISFKLVQDLCYSKNQKTQLS